MYKGFIISESATNDCYSFMLFDDDMHIINKLPDSLKDDPHLENKGSHIDFVGDLAHVDYFFYDGYLMPLEPFDNFSYSNGWTRGYMSTGAPLTA